MKLLFPNGEHPQVLLNDGVTRIGASPGCQVVVEGLAPVHGEINLVGAHASVRRVSPDQALTVNGNVVASETQLRPGDLIGLGQVQARVVAVERAASVAPPKRSADVDDAGATRMRMAVPRFVLRGVSGAAFGKTFPVGKEVLIGRQADCDIPVPAEEVSRHHARAKPTADGVMIEDLGSANGTYVNGKRIQTGLLKPGDELRLDTIRFLLIAPGQEIPKTAVAPAAAPAAKGNAGLVVGVAVAVVAIAAAAWYFLA